MLELPIGLIKLQDTRRKRELQVYNLLLKGHAVASIAELMCLSVAGVKFHITNIYLAHNAKNRREFMALHIEKLRGVL